MSRSGIPLSPDTRLESRSMITYLFRNIVVISNTEFWENQTNKNLLRYKLIAWAWYDGPAVFFFVPVSGEDFPSWRQRWESIKWDVLVVNDNGGIVHYYLITIVINQVERFFVFVIIHNRSEDRSRLDLNLSYFVFTLFTGWLAGSRLCSYWQGQDLWL